MTLEPPQRWPQPRLFTLPIVVGLGLLPAWAWSAERDLDALQTTIPSYALPTIGLLLLVIALNGLFVAADTALELLRPSHVRLFENGRQARLQELLDRRSNYVAACTLGSQSCRAWMMILSFVPAPALAHRYAEAASVPEQWWHVLVAGVLVTIPVATVNVVFGELVPKSYAALHPHRVALRTERVIRWTRALLMIPSVALMGLANVITRRFGAVASFALPNQAEEEIKSLVESAEETGEIEAEEREMLNSVFEFGDTVAREVMTPRVDLDSAAVTSTPEELLTLIQSTGHSRIPLYEDTDDQIVGVIHVKDLLGALTNGDSRPVNLRTLMRPAYFVPENKNLHDLLTEMRFHRTQIAIVQDEYGGTAGIVTIEDIVEEIVGDIVDEYDVEEREIVEAEGGWTVEGKINLYDLNGAIGSNFASEEFDTLGGYLFGLFGRQPKLEETLDHEEYRFTVLQTDGRRILKVKIERLGGFAEALDELTG